MLDIREVLGIQKLNAMVECLNWTLKMLLGKRAVEFGHVVTLPMNVLERSFLLVFA